MDPDGRPDGHRGYEDMAVAHVMGGLGEDDGRVFRVHLLECGDCRARVGELRAIAHELAGVERDEQRVRSAKTLEMKSRESEGEPTSAPKSRARWRSRAAVFVAVTGVVMLASYVFALRGQVTSLEQALEQRLAASAAMEHGERLEILYTAPEIEAATARRHGDDVVVLLEGLDSEQVYGLYLLDGSGPAARTIHREPRRPENGRLFVLFSLQGDETQFIVSRPTNGVDADPSGTTMFEAHLDRYADDG